MRGVAGEWVVAMISTEPAAPAPALAAGRKLRAGTAGAARPSVLHAAFTACHHFLHATEFSREATVIQARTHARTELQGQ